MLKIEMDDVIGVLQSCKVQIGVIVGVLALLVIDYCLPQDEKKSEIPDSFAVSDCSCTGYFGHSQYGLLWPYVYSY